MSTQTIYVTNGNHVKTETSMFCTKVYLNGYEAPVCFRGPNNHQKACRFLRMSREDQEIEKNKAPVRDGTLLALAGLAFAVAFAARALGGFN